MQKYTLSIYRKLIRVAQDKHQEKLKQEGLPNEHASNNDENVHNILLERIKSEFRERKDIDRMSMDQIEYWVRYAERQLEVLKDSQGMTTMVVQRRD